MSVANWLNQWPPVTKHCLQQWLSNTAATSPRHSWFSLQGHNDRDNWKGKSIGLKDKTSVKIDQKAAMKRENGARKLKSQKKNKQQLQMNGFSLSPQGKSYGECLSTDVFRAMEFHQCPLQHRVPLLHLYTSMWVTCISNVTSKLSGRRERKKNKREETA